MSKTKQLIEVIEPHVNLYRDSNTGIAWVEDGRTGCGHSCHPNIDASGSVRGMIARRYWHEDDLVILTNGFKYNVSKFMASTDYDLVAAKHCQCRGCLLRKNKDLEAKIASLQQTLRNDLSRDTEIYQEVIGLYS